MSGICSVASIGNEASEFLGESVTWLKKMRVGVVMKNGMAFLMLLVISGLGCVYNCHAMLGAEGQRVSAYLHYQVYHINRLRIRPSVLKGHDTSFVSSILANTDYATIREIQFIKKKASLNIAILEDQQGDKFVVKQNLKSLAGSVLRVAREKLGVEMAESMGIEVNSVEIIPSHCSFIGKRILAWPATLHTFSPGIQVSKLPKTSPFYKMDIRQSVDLSGSTSGLQYHMIQDMALHQDLPAIVALDTFTCNKGRHRNNYFYCPEKDHFYLIDMESCFAYPLGMYACACITKLLESTSVVLPSQEVVALTQYNEALKKLIALYSPQTIYEQLVANVIGCDAGIKHASLPKYRDTIKTIEETMPECVLMAAQHSDPCVRGFQKREDSLEQSLLEYLHVIQQNYASCIQLTELLDKLLSRY